MIKIVDLLKEDIYGNYATVYHRTRSSDLVKNIFDTGFQVGGGNMYGTGMYGTYKLEDQLGNGMSGKYGSIIVKFAVSLTKFIIFDYSEYLKSTTSKGVKHTSSDFIQKQFEALGIDTSRYSLTSYLTNTQNMTYSSDLAKRCYDSIPGLVNMIGGLIFTGRQDGKVLVKYKPRNTCMPLSYTEDDGVTWIKFDKKLEFVKKFFDSKEPNKAKTVDDWMDDLGITNFTLYKDGSVDIGEDLNLNDAQLTKFPFKVNEVKGDFRCTTNKLTSLVGGPKKVLGDYICVNNQLTSLAGAPSFVQGTFDVSNNKLTSLKGLSLNKVTNFICSANQLTSLKGSPRIVTNFVCSDNTSLISLEGGPVQATNYNASNCGLKSLKGAPIIVSNEFNCMDNSDLFNLIGLPKDSYYNSLNLAGCLNLDSLEGIPVRMGQITLPLGIPGIDIATAKTMSKIAR